MRAPPLDPAVLTRLVKLLGLLSSAHDGERATAGRMADKLLHQHKFTWPEVIALQQQQTFDGSHDDTYAAIAFALDNKGLLTPWERKFCHSLNAQSRFSPEQEKCLAEIIAKVKRVRAAEA